MPWQTYSTPTKVAKDSCEVFIQLQLNYIIPTLHANATIYTFLSFYSLWYVWTISYNVCFVSHFTSLCNFYTYVLIRIYHYELLCKNTLCDACTVITVPLSVTWKKMLMEYSCLVVLLVPVQVMDRVQEPQLICPLCHPLKRLAFISFP